MMNSFFTFLFIIFTFTTFVTLFLSNHFAVAFVPRPSPANRVFVHSATRAQYDFIKDESAVALLKSKDETIQLAIREIQGKDDTIKLVTEAKEEAMKAKDEVIKEKDKRLDDKENQLLQIRAKYTAVVNLRPLMELKLNMWWRNKEKDDAVTKIPFTTTGKLKQFFAAVQGDKCFDACFKSACERYKEETTGNSPPFVRVKDEVPNLFGKLSDDIHQLQSTGMTGFVVGGKDTDTNLALSGFLMYFGVPHCVMGDDFKTVLYDFDGTSDRELQKVCQELWQNPNVYGWDNGVF